MKLLFARDTLVFTLVGSLVLGPGATALANPSEGHSNSPGVVIPPTSPSMTIRAPNGSIIRWSRFDIENGESVHFDQLGNANARVLNRVTSSDPSRINGALTADGHVFIVNPAGVVFGANATVNVNGIHAAGGQISDQDFIDGNDRFTGVRGDVTLEGTGATGAQITARAVSLVGEHVVIQSGGRVFADGGWIVIAAGNDVLIGRDDAGNGMLLRVEGAAGAVFDRNATGVLNQGTLDAGLGATGGTVRIGAGDLYGTAIFSDEAIRARQVALEANGRGDIALGGTVQSTDLDVVMRGARTGELQGVGGPTTTVRADNVKLTATGLGSTMNVGDDLRFRGQASETAGPLTVAVTQGDTLATTDLENLDIAPGAGTALTLKSVGGDVIVDDRRLVTGTDLTLEAAATSAAVHEIRGTETLNVASLHAKGATRTEADIVASGTRGITVTQNLTIVTKEGAAEDPSVQSLLSARDGALDVDGDIAMTDGGRLRIEADRVEVGKEEDGIRTGGAIRTVGTAQGGVTIDLAESVKVTAIDTRGLLGGEGGDVDVRASGDVEIGAISTAGGANEDLTMPNHDGGSVVVQAGDELKIGTVVTGGADDRARAGIELSADSIVLAGGLDASGGTLRNARGGRDRDVTVDGALSLDGDVVSILGGDVEVTGPVTEAVSSTAGQREVDFGLQSSGTTRLGDVDVQTLTISSKGNEVVFTGTVQAAESVTVAFDIDGAPGDPAPGEPDPNLGTIRGARPGGGDALVISKSISVAALDLDSPEGRNAELVLGDGVEFRVSSTPPTAPGGQATAGFFLFSQDRSIDGAKVTDLLDRVTATDGTPLALELHSNDAVSLDAAARAAMTAEDLGLRVVARRFNAVGASGAATDFDLRSLDVKTQEALNVNFGVTASGDRDIDGVVSLQGGASGAGNLTVAAPVRIDAETVKLIAGDGTAGVGTESRVVIDPGARLKTARTTTVDLVQDAAIDTANLPDLAVFGGNVSGLNYGLESRDGNVVLSEGSEANFANSRLRLFGQTGIEIGTDDLTLASLDASTAEALRVRDRIQITEGGTLRLHAGTDGTGDLTVEALIDADNIELLAGSLDQIGTTSRVEIGRESHFSSSSGDTHPLSFLLEQDASIGPTPGEGAETLIPPLDMFEGGSVAGMRYVLRSQGGTVAVDAGLVDGTDLELVSRNGTTVTGNLSNLEGLKVRGASSFSGNVVSNGAVDVIGPVTLNGVGTQQFHAGDEVGDNMIVQGAIQKTTAGAIDIDGHNVEVGSVTTAHSGDAIDIRGAVRVKTGALDASGRSRAAGGAVTVESESGTVEVASVDTSGADGSGSAASPSPGAAGGAVVLEGITVAVGDVNTTGGNASTLSQNSNRPPLRGGDAGAVTITALAPGPGITLRGSIDARGGAGSSSDPDTTPAPRGDSSAIALNGDVLLDATSNELRGRTVTVAGGVSPIASRVPVSLPGNTALVVVAENGVSFGGDLAATRIDIETRTGNLALGSAGVSRISANTIRLAATDGAGGSDAGQVDLNGITFANEPRTGTPPTATPFRLRVEQDASIGTGGTELPADGIFAGVTSERISLGLVSLDGDIQLDGAAHAGTLTGRDLVLAANGRAGSAGPAIRVNGMDIDVESLSLGAEGSDGQLIGGDARIDGNVTVSKSFISFGDTTITRNASLSGTASFAGEGDQALHVEGGTLELLAGTVSKTSEGSLHLDADRIELSPTLSQTIENLGGTLEIGSADADGLVKGTFTDTGAPVTVNPSNLTLRGVAAEGGDAAVIVYGTRETPGVGTHAVLVADGNLLIDARVAPDDSGDPVGPGTWSVDGDVVAYGDVDLLGSGVLDGGRDSYLIEARRQALASRTDRGGELSIAGLTSADGALVLKGVGSLPPADQPDPHPTGIFTSGDFATDHALTFAGATEAEEATTIAAGGDVTFTGRVQGSRDFAVSSARQVAFQDDVMISDASFSASGDQGVMFTSNAQQQVVQAKHIQLGSSASRPGGSRASVFRDGDLKLDAIGGDLMIARGQQVVVTGKLDAAATYTATLANVAAQGIDVSAGTVAIHGGSTLAANRIGLSGEPRVRGGGTAFFATPTGTEISDNAQTENVVLRQLGENGERLTRESLIRFEPGGVAAGVFPAADGPARIDFATETPRLLRPAAILRPKADAQDLALAREARPLWADELLVYLEERSLVAPTVQEQAALPPVNAGPSDAKAATGGVPLGEAALQTLPAYRELFRPETEIDPETGLIVGDDRVRAIRAAFAEAQAKGGDLGSAIEATPQAREDRDRLAALFAASARALDARQNARFREMVVARVAPAGVSPQQLDALIP